MIKIMHPAILRMVLFFPGTGTGEDKSEQQVWPAIVANSPQKWKEGESMPINLHTFKDGGDGSVYFNDVEHRDTAAEGEPFWDWPEHLKKEEMEEN